MCGLPRRSTPELSSPHALHPGVGTQPAPGLATGPSINQGTKFIASCNSRSHLNVSVRLFTARALVTPVRVPTRCSFVLVDLPSQMPRSHDEPSLPSWAPDSFARTASPKLSNGRWNLLMVNSSKGVLPLDRTTNRFLRKTLMSHQPWENRRG